MASSHVMQDYQDIVEKWAWLLKKGLEDISSKRWSTQKSNFLSNFSQSLKTWSWLCFPPVTRRRRTTALTKIFQKELYYRFWIWHIDLTPGFQLRGGLTQCWGPYGPHTGVPLQHEFEFFSISLTKRWDPDWPQYGVPLQHELIQLNPCWGPVVTWF